MADLTNDTDVLEFEHDDGHTQGAEDGTELASVLRSDPDWTLISTEPADGEPVDYSALDGAQLLVLKRPQLNAAADQAGVESPEQLGTKPDVVRAILAARESA